MSSNALPPLEITVGCDAVLIYILPGIRLPENGEPVRIFVRKRPQQYGVYDAEDRCIGAQSSSASVNTATAVKPGDLRSETQRVPHIPQDSLNRRKPAPRAIDFLRLLDAADGV